MTGGKRIAESLRTRFGVNPLSLLGESTIEAGKNVKRRCVLSKKPCQVCVPYGT